MTTTIPTTGACPPTAQRSRIGSERDGPSGSRLDGGFLLTLWTEDPVLASYGDDAGIDRIGLDLEIVGKRERQRGLGTRISGHRIERLAEVGNALQRAQLFVRVNPLGRRTAAEVSRVLELGAQVLMLPMFESAAEVRRFLDLVAGRATVIPLLETAAAAADVAALVALPEITELHVGINDLSLSLGLPRRFDVFGSPVVRQIAREAHRAGTRLGIGGIGRVDDQTLPVAPDLVYAQYPRLGATAALVSRAFIRPDVSAAQLRLDVERCRARLADWFCGPTAALQRAHQAFLDAVRTSRNW